MSDYKIYHAQYRFEPGADLKKVLAAVEKYNKRATSYGGFQLWQFDQTSRTLTGNLNEQLPEETKSFWAELKHAYKTGALEELFEKICKAAEKAGGVEIAKQVLTYKEDS